MEITKILPLRNDKDRVQIYSYDELLFTCDREFLYKNKLKVGMHIEINEIGDIIEKDGFIRGKSYAMNILSRGLKPEKEIRDKLINKNYSEDNVNKIVEFLKEYNFLNDENYALSFIQKKIKNTGKNSIKYALIQKGIDSSVIDKMLNHSVNVDDEINAALQIGVKKYNSLLKLKKYDSKDIKFKTYSFLISKGYNYETAKKVVEKICDEHSL